MSCKAEPKTRVFVGSYKTEINDVVRVIECVSVLLGLIGGKSMAANK